MPENLGKYRGLLSKSDYRKFLASGQTLQQGGKDGYVAATGDVTMLKNTLNKYDMGDLHTAKNKKKKNKYIAIHEAWKNEINAQQIAKGNVKLSRTEKQLALNTVLMDRVNIDGFWADTKDKNIYFVDDDRLEDVYVDIEYEGEKKRIFTSKIDPPVLMKIQQSLRKFNKPVNQNSIAELWLKKGSPKNLSELYAED